MTPDDVVTRIRSLARLHGWAIGAHGSMARDIDLIAVPWTDEASPMHVLLAAICTRLELVTLNGDDVHNITPRTRYRWSTLLKTKASEISKVEHGPTDQRTFWDPPAIDLTLVDPRERIPPVVPLEPPTDEK